ncbi:MAG: TolC family protein [Ignavibacteriales bacterium]|nr:TolC family protein [Ignavibacteriales bacterium]
MRQLCLFITILVFGIIQLQAQITISLDDAIRQALDKNIELQKQHSIRQKSQSQLNESIRIPNPTFNYSREDLKFNNSTIGEWIASGSLELNFLWNRWTNIDSKEKFLEAQRLLLENAKSNTIFQVKDIYIKYHLYNQLSIGLDEAYDKIDKIASISKDRVEAGDISEYEMQRILIEVNKLKTEVVGIDLERNNYQNKLKLLIGLDSDGELKTLPIQPAQNNFQSDKELLHAAMKNRNDLKAIEQLIESESAFLSHSKMKIIPNINLTAGYKKQFDDYSGSVFQLNFEIPLFKRNQLEIEQSTAELTVLEQQKEYLVKQIGTEVQASFAKYKQYAALTADKNDFQFQNLFSTAVYSYEQGDISLVEFIDGLNAYKEGIKLNKELEIKYYQSLFELENVTAISAINKIIKGDQND